MNIHFSRLRPMTAKVGNVFRLGKRFVWRSCARGSRPARGEEASRVRTLRMLPLAAVLVVGLIVGAAGAQVTKETADVVGQGPAGPIVSADGATLRRSDSGLTMSLRMPTPEPGTYAYPPANMFQPEGAFPGHPEAFSLWAFVFNFPELCTNACDADDLAPGAPAMGGVFNVAGHVVGGPHLQLSGHVTLNSPPFAGSPLLEPRTAEVHLAVAPHGALQPDIMPNQLKMPIGSPPFWWLAFFVD